MGDVKLDPTIMIRPSEQLMELIESLENPLSSHRDSTEERKRLTVENINHIRAQLTKEQRRHLYNVLLASQVELPSPVFPERNPQLEKRCQQLRMQQNEREYRSMTRNIRENEFEEKPLSLQFKELNSILVMLVQFLVSVLASFMFGYLAPYYLYGRTDVGSRVLSGTLAAFFVGIADMYFVIREHLRDDGVDLINKKTE